MNSRMSTLMQRLGVQWPLGADANAAEIPRLELVQDCVLLKDEFERNRHVKVSGLPDKTGFECFLNHVHFCFTGTRESFVSCLGYAAALQEALMPLAQSRRFRVIVGISEDDCSPSFNCTVRFHQIRPGEVWLSEDLEGYESEAILFFDVPSGAE